jgi:hypothetical protein
MAGELLVELGLEPSIPLPDSRSLRCATVLLLAASCKSEIDCVVCIQTICETK